MSTHFKWYPAESEVVVPFNARYSFPSQANKAIKMTPRIPPKNAGTFSPGNVIRLEFPAQGYINPGKTTLEFDVTMLYAPNDGEFSYLRFQNNIQSIFNRVRLLYGATPIEDIPYYNVIVRQLTEWTGTNQTNISDQFSISDGIGGVTAGLSGQFGITSQNTGARATGDVNVRQKYIQGIDLVENIGLATPLVTGTVSTPYVVNAWDVGVAASNSGNVMGTAFAGNGALGYSGYGMVPNNNDVPLAAGTNFTGTVHPTVTGTNPVRRYQVQLALGIFNQEKLIPTKFMASQLAIEITLENPNACMYFQTSPTFTYATAADPNANPILTATGYGTPATVQPSYQVTNVNLIPEILEFDASYDESFLKGLQTGGVPIKFSTWNNYRFSNN